MVKIIGEVITKKLGHRREILAPLSFHFDDGFVCEVDKGFITDGATVPRFAWWFLSPYGEAYKAAICHDCLITKYRNLMTWNEAANRFKAVLIADGVSKFKANTAAALIKIYGIYLKSNNYIDG